MPIDRAHGRLIGPASHPRISRMNRKLSQYIFPNIVHVFDFDIEKDIPFMVMDYAPNSNLRKLHPRGTQVQKGKIMSEVARLL